MRAAPGDGTTAFGISNQSYNSMLQGYDYVSGVYKGISLNPLGGSVSVGRNLLGTPDDIAKFVVRGRGATNATTTMRVENTNASASLVVLDNGYVGVGTANPTYKFYASDTGTSGITHFLAFRNDNNDYGGITIGSGVGQNLTIQQNSGYGYLSTSGFRIGSTNGVIWTNNGSIFRIVDAATEAISYLRIANTTGNVLINTSTDSGFKLDVSGSGRFTNNLTVTGSFNSYTTSSAGLLAIVSGSQPAQDIAFNFRKIGESIDGGKHTMMVEGTGGQDTNIYFGVNQVGSIRGSMFSIKGNNSVNINMPSSTGNYGGLAVGGWLSSYPSLLVRGFGSTSATTALRVENTNATPSMVVLDNGFVGIGTGSAQYNLDVSGSTRSNNFRSTDSSFIVTQYTTGGTVVTVSAIGHNGSVGINVTGATGIRATSALGINNNNPTGASIYAAGGAINSSYISLGVLSNRALITSVTNGLAMHTSSMLQVDSTTQGLLPPRTNLTSNILTPAQGLMTYLTGSTNEGLYYHNSGSQPGWHKILTNTGSQSITGSLTVTGASSFSNGLTISSSTTINDAFAINIPEAGGPIDDTRPAGFYKATINGVEAFLPYYL